MSEARKSTKITDDEAKGLNRKEMGVVITGTAEVEGQDPYIGRIQCAWCGNIGRAILDTDHYKYFACGACGRHIRA